MGLTYVTVTMKYAEPLLGGTALESVVVVVDPANRALKRLPAIPLK